MQISNEIKKIEEYICENFEEWDLDDPVEEEYIDDYKEIEGASEEEISVFEEKFGITLPEDVKELYRYKNGSKYLSILPCVIDEREMAFNLMSLDAIEKAKKYFQLKIFRRVKWCATYRSTYTKAKSSASRGLWVRDGRSWQ